MSINKEDLNRLIELNKKISDCEFSIGFIERMIESDKPKGQKVHNYRERVQELNDLKVKFGVLTREKNELIAKINS